MPAVEPETLICGPWPKLSQAQLRCQQAAHSPHFILAAARFPKVGDGGELCVNGLAVEPAVVEVHDCFLRVLLAPKLHPKRTHRSTISFRLH